MRWVSLCWDRPPDVSSQSDSLSVSPSVDDRGVLRVRGIAVALRDQQQRGHQRSASGLRRGPLPGVRSPVDGRQQPGLGSALQPEEEERHVAAGLRLSAGLCWSGAGPAAAGQTAGGAQTAERRPDCSAVE